VAPLTMWYRTSIQRLGRTILWPVIGSSVFVVILFVLGVRLWPALLGFWLVSFSVILTVWEFVKGTRARMGKGENVWTAFTTLMARNRRRYGGYWIHMGVLVMAFGIVADGMYQTETQIRLNAGEGVQVGDFEMVFNSVSRFAGADDLLITEADVDLYKNGEFPAQAEPADRLLSAQRPADDHPFGPLDHHRGLLRHPRQLGTDDGRRGHLPHLPQPAH
jgi:cytochrome c-type biogenesis protein CcmF